MKSFKDLVSPVKGAGQRGEIPGVEPALSPAFPGSANPLTHFAYTATERPYQLMELQEGYALEPPESKSQPDFPSSETLDTFWNNRTEYEEVWNYPQLTPPAYSARQKWPVMEQPIETAFTSYLDTFQSPFDETRPSPPSTYFPHLPSNSNFWSPPPPLEDVVLTAGPDPWVDQFYHFSPSLSEFDKNVEKSLILKQREDTVEGVDASQAWAEEFQEEGNNQAEDLAAAYEESTRLKDASPSFDKDEARQLAEFLRKMNDPKVDRSEFLNFVDNFASGAIKFGDKKIHPPQETSSSSPLTVEKENNIISSASEWSVDGTMRELEAIWDRAKQNGEITEEEFQVFTSAFQGDADDDAIDSAWWNITERPQTKASAPLEENWMTEHGNDYAHEFLSSAEDNPYREMNSLLTLVKEFLSQGKVQDAMLACEAEIQRNPESSEGWRLLGQMHADNEQDVEAIACLKRGHEVDPYNLDSLLALGVSLINELDAPEALRQLKMWIENNEDFQHIQGVGDTTSGNFSELTNTVIHLFQEALQFRPHNSDVLTALGVICNITKNYEEAVRYFSQAILHGPPSALPSLWNKIGATLANFGRSEAALLAYEQTLQLKPNYPRAWTNLGVAYANLGDMENALKYYLTALVLNPKATHLWYYIRVAAMNLGHHDILQFVNNQDIDGLKAHFPEKIINGPEGLSPATVPSYDNFNSIISRIFNML
uniref:Peroxisomal biogenesis factor 5 n=1 Tax=Cardiosporidium cionae TaxID=476202 RepID=A0A3S8V2V5_9APIC|nr:peroxisomal biogenesis factor 5 [Cardiosporidium cionae]